MGAPGDNKGPSRAQGGRRQGRAMPTRTAHTAKPWDAEERAWARECLEAGDTVAEVAEWAGRTKGDVRRALDLPHAAAGKPKRADQIAELLRAGVPRPQVGERMGVSRQRVHQVARTLAG